MRDPTDDTRLVYHSWVNKALACVIVLVIAPYHGHKGGEASSQLGRELGSRSFSSSSGSFQSEVPANRGFGHVMVQLVKERQRHYRLSQFTSLTVRWERKRDEMEKKGGGGGSEVDGGKTSRWKGEVRLG